MVFKVVGPALARAELREIKDERYHWANQVTNGVLLCPSLE